MDALRLPSPVVYAAIIPCYDNGNAVKTIRLDGKSEIVHKNIRSFMRALEAESSIDIKGLKRNYLESLNRRNLIPIPLGVEIVMIPLRVRRGVAPGDGTMAYINLMQIKDMVGEKDVVIWLENGENICTLESKKTIIKRMNVAYSIKEKYCSAMLNTSSIKGALLDIENEYKSPATKGDIAILIKELKDFRNCVESRFSSLY